MNSVLIFHQSFLISSSNVEHWKRFNSSISFRLFTWTKCFSFMLHEDTDNVQIIVDVVEVVHRLQQQDQLINFSSLTLDNSIQFLDTSPVRIGLKLVHLTMDSKISDDPFLLQGESWLFRFPFSRNDIRFRERSVFGQVARLLSWRSASGLSPWRWPHGRRGRNGKRRRMDGRDTR